MFTNEISGNKSLTIKALVIKRVTTLLKVAVLVSLLVLNKSVKEKRIALEAGLQEKQIVNSVAQQKPGKDVGKLIFIPVNTQPSLSIAQ